MKRGEVCYGMLRAAACVDESDHHALMYGGGRGGAAGGEGGGRCCTSAIAITHMRAHRAREKNSTRLGRVALTGGPVCV